ncbi:MAG: hypothetical protein MK096_00660 [Oleiphilaceae bacterium]|nr:hypothetical protein [Oleiphilaceae bacterium]
MRKKLCFQTRKGEPEEIAKNVLNCFSEKENFAELMESVFLYDGGYELDEVPGIAVWGEDSRVDLEMDFGFKKFDGVICFYDYPDGVQEVSANYDFSAFVPLLKEAFSYNARLYQHRQSFLEEIFQSISAKYRK